ncbi:autotransporter outer membrane beta-barrel domain-containing protein [Leptotrichia sp. HSP-342]|uniref:Autotransporter outer membrane beta-barrel domain-containing protein n=1 Tax=Leptotrichia mesophila TaxID=3239303 RepID=A0AB39VCG9_9FUSO
MNKTKKLMLAIFSLIAIVSCGEAGKSGDSGSGTSATTPTAPVTSGPSTSPATTISNMPRFTKTDLSKLANNVDIFKYAVVGEKWIPSARNTTRTRYEVGNHQIGLELSGSSSSPLTVTRSTTINVKAGGAALSFDYYRTAESNSDFANAPQLAMRKYLTEYLKNANKLTINMEPGSYLFVFKGMDVELSKNNIANPLSAVPVSSRPTINGTGYKIFKFDNSTLSIDQNVNLDDPNDLYNQVEFTNTNTHVLKDFKIVGTKDNQIGIKSTESFDRGGWNISNSNQGTIDLKGNNTVGVYNTRASFTNHSNGKISVNTNSIGIYSIDNNILGNSAGEIENNGLIKLGESSTGIYYEKRWIDYNGSVLNDYLGKIESNSNNVIGISANVRNQKKDPSSPIWVVDIIRNYGNINLNGDKSIGIYAGGDANYNAINDERYGNVGVIKIGDSFEKKNPSIGMYSDNKNAVLINKGIIEIGKNSVGMAGSKSTVLNDAGGIIKITKDGGVGMYLGDGAAGTNNGTITTVGSPKNAIGVVVGKNSEFTNNGTIHIDSAGGAGIVIAGGVVKNYGNIEVSGGAVRSRTDNTYTVKVLSNRVKPVDSDLGVYVDTLGRTKPIEGLSNLGLKNADLLIGAEATEKTNATEVTVGNDVLDPFNKSIEASNIANWNVKTGSLVWEADSEIKNNKVEKVTLKKQSYAKFADSETTEEVAKGLDEKYTETTVDSKDKEVFNYLNTLNNRKLLAKTYKEIDGNQYINVQQRIAQTDNILDSKLSDLQKENVDKSGHHVSTFFNKDKHEARTPEIANTNSSAYGISYLFNNADAKQGIYAGTVINNFKFKDNGKSKENVTMFKLGAYKTFDLNNLEWTLSGDGFVSKNDMKRRFVIGNNVYENKAGYNAYGFVLKNEFGKTFSIGENITVKPYAALKLGYGRFSKIKEKDGTLNMEVKGNDFYSVKPSAGVEFGYSNSITANTKFKASLGLGYEHELGKVESKVNEAKFANTSTKINLKGAKDERRGNFKSNVKVGFEAGNFDLTVNGGYDTKDKNAHVGVGLGVSF